MKMNFTHYLMPIALCLMAASALPAEAGVRQSLKSPRLNPEEIQLENRRAEAPGLEGFYTVNIELPDFDWATYMFAFCGYRNEDNNVDDMAFDDSGCTFYLPAGTYSFSALFIPNDHSKDCEVFVNKDDVTISADTTLTFSTTEATNTITFQPLTPMGEELVPPLQRYIEGTFDRETVEEGNIVASSYDRKIMHRDFGTASTQSGALYRTLMADGSVAESNLELRTNDLSDKWCVAFYCIAEMENGESMMTALGGDASADHIYTTRVEQYESMDFAFAGVQDDDAYGFIMQSGLKDIPNSNSYFSRCRAPKLHMNSGDIYDVVGYRCQIFPYLGKQVDENTFQTLVTAPPVVLGADGDYTTQAYPFYFDPLGNAFMYNSDGERKIVENPSFSYPVENLKYAYGSSAPYIQFSPRICTTEEWFSDLNYALVGFGGEKYGEAGEGAEVKVAYNGKEENLTDWTFGEWSEEQFGVPGENAGEYDVTITAKQGKSSTTAEIHFDTTAADIFPPLFTYLTVFDAAGNVATEINKPEDGTLVFTGGDFDYVVTDDYDTYYAYVSAPDITVEYAPTGDDVYSPLTAVEKEDKFVMPGFGACFEVALAGIDRPSADGWYDLRLTMMDAAGNSNCQTLRKALHIVNSPSGTDLVKAEVDRDIVYFDLLGNRVAPTAKGILLRVTPDGTATKLLNR